MIWGTALHPGEVYTHAVSQELHLTLASIEIRPSKYVDRAPPIAFLVLKTADFENVICTLGKGQTYQQSLDLVFGGGEEFTFQVEGTGIVYVTGYLSAPPGDLQDGGSDQHKETTSILSPPGRVQGGIKHAEQALGTSPDRNRQSLREKHSGVTFEDGEEISVNLSGTPMIELSSVSKHLDDNRHDPSPPSLDSIHEGAVPTEAIELYCASSHQEVGPLQATPSLESTPGGTVGIQECCKQEETVTQVARLESDPTGDIADHGDSRCENDEGLGIKIKEEYIWQEEAGLDEKVEGWCNEGDVKDGRGSSRSLEQHEGDGGEECQTRRVSPLRGEFVTVAGPQEDGDENSGGGNTAAGLSGSHKEADDSKGHTSALFHGNDESVGQLEGSYDMVPHSRLGDSPGYYFSVPTESVSVDDAVLEGTSNKEQLPITLTGESLGDNSQLEHGRAAKRRRSDEFGDASDSGASEEALRLSMGNNSVGSGGTEGSFRCETCGRGFVDQPHLDRHRKTHSIIRPYQCQFCSKSYASKANVIIHERTHTGVRPFCCQFCSKGFAQKSALMIHERIHTGKNHIRCHYCGKGFAQKSALMVVERIHTGYKPHRCQYCGKGFTQKQHLTSHQRTHKDSAIKCQICHLPFSEMESLVSHLKTHEEDNISSCTECGERFTDVASLKEHEKVHHSRTQYSCKLCDGLFRERSEALAHEKTHLEVQPFQCGDCDSYFESGDVLRAHHRKRHTLARLFACKYCEKTYSQKINLVNHERVHTGERPFSCRYCGKGFRMKYTCGVHERTHTGERPFKCKVCGKAFKQSGHMLTHKKTHQK